MHITLSPWRDDATLTLAKSGDRLTINGDTIDFATIPNGATVHDAAQFHDMLTGDIERIDGDIHVTVVLPLGPDAPETVRFPDPITVTADGAIAVPGSEAGT